MHYKRLSVFQVPSNPKIILGLPGLDLLQPPPTNECSALSGLLGSDPSRGGTRKYIQKSREYKCTVEHRSSYDGKEKEGQG